MSEQQKKELEDLILGYLADNPAGIEDSLEFLKQKSRSQDHKVLESVVRSLAVSEFVLYTEKDHKGLALTSEGQQYVIKGSPEAQVYNGIPAEGILQAALLENVGLPEPVFKAGLGVAIKSKWVRADKDKKVYKQAPGIEDDTKNKLQVIEKGQSLDETTVTALKKRRLIIPSEFKTFKITRGPSFARERKKPATDLTDEMLKSGDWKTQEFKAYHWDSKGREFKSGALHPLMKVRYEFRQILLSMGFEEMPTNNFVESSFWNFDALFQPQQHPCRDSHDTFFLIDPKECKDIPEAYKERVKTMHESGGADSIGYRYDWKISEAKKNILRTHTTAWSTRMLYKLAQGKFQPKKYFSIDRVFRNESIDATHLAEFHQVEGLVADYNLTLGDLIGVIQTFFAKIGIPDVRFKPAYNPYTEPSMEIFGYSKALDKWMEIGNSGVFRPEMLIPMGLPPDVNVIAWGLSLERPTMIKYGIGNIRDLFGYKVKLDGIAKNPICRFF